MKRKPVEVNRRNFVKGATFAGAAALMPAGMASTNAVTTTKSAEGGQVPKKALGKTGLEVSALGVGGFHLGTATDQAEASEIVSRSLDAGVNFFDNAWEYHEGESENRMGQGA